MHCMCVTCTQAHALRLITTQITNPCFGLELNEWYTCKAMPDWAMKGEEKGVFMPISVI